jgi:23S rRNA pseudouridine1911/1915/1917 synthase
MDTTGSTQLSAPPHSKRLDAWLAQEMPEHSRARWQTLIEDKLVKVNGQTVKRNFKLGAGDLVEWTIPEPIPSEVLPEDIPLDILYEDAHMIVINKPAGLVVHPAAGNEQGTLVNALLHHCSDLAGIGGEKRPGIVHRLDKDTSGVMVIAKTEAAMKSLAHQFKHRETEKEYLALVRGTPLDRRAKITAPIGRHPIHRKKMAVNERTGRHASSYYEILEIFECASLLRVRIETGRTHQIRVHMSHIRHPIIGDSLYGRSHKGEPQAARQMLHAEKLSLAHPDTQERMIFHAPIPDDMEELLTQLRSASISNQPI